MAKKELKQVGDVQCGALLRSTLCRDIMRSFKTIPKNSTEQRLDEIWSFSELKQHLFSVAVVNAGSAGQHHCTEAEGRAPCCITQGWVSGLMHMLVLCWLI